MTLEEKAQKISEIADKLRDAKDLYQNMEKLLPVDENLIEVKRRGTKFFLPKALFEAQHKKVLIDKENEIKQLEIDLNDAIKVAITQ